jgi:hypothetical protein
MFSRSILTAATVAVEFARLLPVARGWPVILKTATPLAINAQVIAMSRILP